MGPTARLGRKLKWLIGALALAFMATSPAMADPVACPGDESVAVEAARSELATQLCEAAPPLRDAMVDCGLTQLRALKIVVIARLIGPFDTSLAEFDRGTDVIRIVDPLLYPGLLVEDGGYFLLPTDVLLRSLLTHEIAHALAFQVSGDRELDAVDQEYIAAAMELELMKTEWRDFLIKAAPVTLPPKDEMINFWIYAMAPRKFAVNAWRHFRLPENGCALIRRIIGGEASFSEEAKAWDLSDNNVSEE